MCRMSFLSIMIAFVIILGSTGCSGKSPNKLPSAAKSILENADQIEVLSLDPGQPGEPPPKGDYHSWKVLGKTVIQDVDTRKSIVTAVERGIAEGRMPAACFDPRHAIHATHKGKAADILICFHCSQVLVYVDNEQQEPYLEISAPAESVLDKVLTEANVPLAPKPKR